MSSSMSGLAVRPSSSAIFIHVLATVICKLHNQLRKQPLLCGLSTRDRFPFLHHVIHVPIAGKVSIVTVSTQGNIFVLWVSVAHLPLKKSVSAYFAGADNHTQKPAASSGVSVRTLSKCCGMPYSASLVITPPEPATVRRSRETRRRAKYLGGTQMHARPCPRTKR